VIQISVTFGSYVRPTIDPEFINWSTFLLPLPALTNVITIAVIAFNKNQDVALLQRNVVVNGNDLTSIMHYSVLALCIKIGLMIFLMPWKIYNDPKEPVGFFYLCTERFWKKLCKNESSGDSNADGSRVGQIDETMEALTDSDST
jgi:hypothetical protein